MVWVRLPFHVVDAGTLATWLPQHGWPAEPRTRALYERAAAELASFDGSDAEGEQLVALAERLRAEATNAQDDPDLYDHFAEALAIAVDRVAEVVLWNARTGISRAAAREAGRRVERDMARARGTPEEPLRRPHDGSEFDAALRDVGEDIRRSPAASMSEAGLIAATAAALEANRAARRDARLDAWVNELKEDLERARDAVKRLHLNQGRVLMQPEDVPPASHAAEREADGTSAHAHPPEAGDTERDPSSPT